MQIVLLGLGIATLLACVASGIEITLGGRRLMHLEQIAPIGNAGAPRISVVIPACNEESTIEEALQSVLRQDYPDFEVIAIDDRSTDETGTILEKAAAVNARLRVIHILDLPPGWLGKNHALQKGGEGASGSLILFTDADVVMDASVLRRAAAWMQTNALDHLAMAPRAVVGGFLANSFLAVFALLFTMFTKAWAVKDPASSKHIGIGAFNMVRAETWRRVGGHTRIAMRPDDDMKLGKLIKMGGFRQDFVLGTRLLVVEWYRSFAEMRRGLMKNLFAGADYRVGVVLAGCVFQMVFLVWPFVAVFAIGGAAQAVNALVLAALFFFFAMNAGMVGMSRWWYLALPVGAMAGVYLMLRAMILNLTQGGIEWRGTRYRLEELRRNRV